MHLIAIPAAIIGRILLALLFIIAGVGKLTTVAATEQYFTSLGLPSGLAIPVGLFEAVGGLLLLIGFLTRPLALLFAVFCIAAALLGHNELSDPMQFSIFLKNVAIAGGFLMLFAYGNMAFSLDHVRARRRKDQIVHDKELAAARTRKTTVAAE